MSSAIYFDGNASTGLFTTSGLPAINHTVCFFATIDQIVTANFGCFYQLSTANVSSVLELALATDGLSVECSSTAGGSVGILTMSVGQWYFFAAVQSGSTIKLYGKPVGAPTCTTASMTADTGWTPAQLAVGVEDAGSGTFDDPLSGSICGLRIWSGAALTQEELERESEQIAPVRTADLFAHWPLTSDKDVRDATARGSLLTVRSTAHVFQRSGPPLPEVKARRWSRFAPPAASAAPEEYAPDAGVLWTPPSAILLASIEEYIPIPALALEECPPAFQSQDVAIYAMPFTPVEEIVATAAPTVALEEYAPPPQPQDVALAAPLFAQAEEIVAAAVAAAALEEWHAPFQADAMAAGATPAPVGDELPSSGGWLEEWSPAFAPDAYAPSPLLFAADEELPFFIAPTFAPEEWAPWQPETWAPATPVLFAQEEWLQIPVRAFEEYAPPVFPPGPDTSGGSYLAAAWLGEELVVFTPPPPSTGGIVFWNRHDRRVIRGR